MGLTAAEIEALKKNFDPAKGPQTVDEWLYLGGNSLNVMNNLAVANARLANAIATALNEQKEVVTEVANMIDSVSKTKNDLERYKSTESDLLKPVLMVKDAKPSDIAALNDLWTRIKSSGITIPPEIKTAFESALNKNESPSLTGKDYQTLSAALQTRSESLSTTSQQESLRLQTLTSRYTQANEQATTVQQKDSQNKANVTNNLRGSG